MGTKTYSGMSAGIFLIGLGLLFLTHVGIWPWILVVIGVASLPASLAAQKGWYGWQGSMWLIGLAILFATGQLFPGILILVGLSAIGSALTRDAPGSPFSDAPAETPASSAPGATRPLAASPVDQPAESTAPTTRLEDPPADGNPAAG